jgi:riboflavin synthase
MFTGIVTALGTVREVQPIGGGHDLRLVMGVTPDFLLQPTPAVLGASICCSGVCLTVVQLSADSFSVDASAETGGHLVSGHVDGVAEVISAIPENASVRWRFRAPEALAPFIASKGSVALDGVSLTVNEVDGATFGVNIIPHTAAMTGFGTLQPGDRVNIEIDTLARYVARMLEFRA